MSLPKIKYPKFLLLFLSFCMAYFIFAGENFPVVESAVISFGYGGSFIAGMLYVYGFTSAIGTAILLIMPKYYGILLSGLVGGLGSLVGDMIIFGFIKCSFNDEVKLLSDERLVRRARGLVPGQLRKIIVPAIAAAIIASPLPDEIGITMLAASGNLSARQFAAISYVLNTAGIFAILLIGSSL